MTHRSALLGEEYRVWKHASGLDVYIFPKKMTATYAIFGTKYGSIHNRFRTDESSPMMTVPDGIAHFLEHKLFTAEDGSDAFERFSEYGADANAYTSFNKTCYLFSCTERFDDSLRELLSFVTHPYLPPNRLPRKWELFPRKSECTTTTPPTVVFTECSRRCITRTASEGTSAVR